MVGKVQGVSVVSVVNNLDVRRECLDSSIAGREEIEFIPIDNTNGGFATAGAALNHGARQARHDVIVFVHQDVYLHSVDRLLEAAASMAGDSRWGMLGAVGITSDGRYFGRMRDRVELLGQSAPDPVEVDSLDEVLFMLPRNLVLERPISEHPELAWHAYAVEYGIRVRERGLQVGAVDLAITHNSMTTNLAQLDVAHRRVATMHLEAIPLRTTCGTIGGEVKDRLRNLPWIGRHGWRFRWLRESLLVARARQHLNIPGVIGDIRSDVDLLQVGEGRVLHVINIDDGSFSPFQSGTLRLTRRSREVRFGAVSSEQELVAALRRVPAGDSALVTQLSVEHLRSLSALLDQSGVPTLLGVHDGMLWLVTGPAATRLPSVWQQPRAVPFGGGRVLMPAEA